MTKMNHGDFRQFVTSGMYEMVQKVLDAKANRRRPYYIMVVIRATYQGPPSISRFENGMPVQNPTQVMNIKGCIGHARVFLIEPCDITKHPPQLGTICWRVNNKTGEVKLKWALPFDKPNTTPDSDNAGDVATLAAESARNLNVPLIFN